MGHSSRSTARSFVKSRRWNTEALAVGAVHYFTEQGSTSEWQVTLPSRSIPTDDHVASTGAPSRHCHHAQVTATAHLASAVRAYTTVREVSP